MHDPAKDTHNRARESVSGKRPEVCIAGHVTRCYRRTVLRPHGTSDWLLIYTLGGRAFFRQEDVRFEVHAGDLVMFEPGTYHHYAPLEPDGWDCLWAHFIPRPAWINMLRLPAAGQGLFRLRVADRSTRGLLRAAFFRVIKYSQTVPVSFGQELAMSALDEIAWLLARESALSAGEKRVSPSVRCVMECLAEDLAGKHTLAALARVAHLSPSRLTHRFKEETGEAVIAYLLRQRLQHAARLLELSGQRIKEVSQTVGFASPFYFSRQFRKAFGVSPREYAKRGLHGLEEKSKHHG
jgi:AraC family transcriptional regulator, arabinose operon regulatory protein